MRYPLFAIALLASTAHAQSISNPGGGGGGAPTGAAGGSLAGTYPNPSIASGVTITSPALVTPALGTPASGVATNLTGTAAGLTAGNVTTNANLTGGVTSVGNAATVITNANLTGPVTSTGNATLTAAAFTMGAADSASPAAETISVPSVVAGTSNTVGALWKFSDSAGTGTGASGGYEWDTHPAGSTGSSQNAAVSKMTLGSSGTLNVMTAIALNAGGNFNWVGRGILTSPAAGKIQAGNTDAASPVAQTLLSQGVVAGTSNTAGVNFTIAAGPGTGSGTGGSLIFQTAPAHGSDTVQGTETTAESITGAGAVAFPLVTTGTNADFVCMSSGNVLTLQTSACTISSARFKNISGPWSGSALSGLHRLTPIVYRMKPMAEPNRDPNFGAVQIGLKAEQIARVFPKCAIYERDMKTPKSYRQECLIAVLVKAVQEQQTEIDALKHSTVEFAAAHAP